MIALVNVRGGTKLVAGGTIHNEKIAVHHAAVIAEQFGQNMAFGVLKLAFKENTDDVRRTHRLAQMIDSRRTMRCHPCIFAQRSPAAIDKFCRGPHDFTNCIRM